MTTADLSVVMPNFNHARYLPRSLEAIFAQSLQPREVIVLDDASTDDSIAVIESFARRHPNLRFVKNESNCGVVANMNRGLELVRTRFAAYSAADDYVLPGFFEKTVSLLERHPQAGLAFGFDSFQFGNDGRPEPNPDGWPAAADYYSPDDVCRHLRHTIAGHTTIFRVDALRGAGGFDPDLAWYADWFAGLTLAFRHGACHLSEPLAIRVLMDGNYSMEAKRSGAKHIAVLQAFFRRIASPSRADVAPLFRRNGAATYFGPDLIRAAATRPDVWEPHILGFLNGFSRDQYRELLDDADPTVSRLAEFFLGPFWQAEEKKRFEELQRLQDELEDAKRRIPPPGARGKLKWLAGLVAKRLRRAG